LDLVTRARAGAPAPGTRLAIQALVGVGGMAALSWEVLWQLQASLALGVSSLGTAITLATTMAGMTVGSLVAGRWLRAREVARPLRLYGWLELAIGLAGLLLLPGFGVLERLDAQVYRVSPGLAPALHAGGIALLLGPPTLAMGASVPVFARIARGYGGAVSVLYGMNTLGAACGALLIAFVLIRTLGVANTCAAVACANLAVFAGSRLVREGAAPLDGVGSDAGAGTGAGTGETPASRGARIPLLVGLAVFTTGFVTFGLEVAWFRSLRAAFQSVTESFAIMLVAVLVPLGVGARLAPVVGRRGIPPGVLLALAGVAIIGVTPILERIDLIAPLSESYTAMLLQWTGLCLAVLGPPMLVLGLVLPWYLDALRDPARCATAYALNTAGAVTGSLLAAWLLLPAFGFARSAWLLGALPIAVSVPMLGGGARLAASVHAAETERPRVGAPPTRRPPAVADPWGPTAGARESGGAAGEGGGPGMAGVGNLEAEQEAVRAEHAQLIEKLSRKGWICKTWEGEMALVSLPGTVSEKFAFSVREDAVAEQINQSLGQRVTLVYEQHVGIPTTCFGDTQYFVTRVSKTAASP
jgi:hypothetical protein